MSKDNGGPAFPFIGRGESWESRGMSLRDYFAAAVLNGTISNPNLRDNSDSQLASLCYKIADAMLVERNKS